MKKVINTIPIPFQNLTLLNQVDFLEKNGFLYLSNSPEEFDILEYAGMFGSIYPQYGGVEIWDVKARKETLDAATSVGAAPILPHSEFYERPGLPPRFVLFYCVNQCKEGGELFLIDIKNILSKTPKNIIQTLEEVPIKFATFNSVSEITNGEEDFSPVLQYPKPRITPILKYSKNWLLNSGNEHLKRFTEIVELTTEENSMILKQPPGSILVWDNWKFLHARRGFSCHDRLLRRICISKD